MNDKNEYEAIGANGKLLIRISKHGTLNTITFFDARAASLFFTNMNLLTYVTLTYIVVYFSLTRGELTLNQFFDTFNCRLVRYQSENSFSLYFRPYKNKPDDAIINAVRNGDDYFFNFEIINRHDLKIKSFGIISNTAHKRINELHHEIIKTPYLTIPTAYCISDIENLPINNHGMLRIVPEIITRLYKDRFFMNLLNNIDSAIRQMTNTHVTHNVKSAINKIRNERNTMFGCVKNACAVVDYNTFLFKFAKNVDFPNLIVPTVTRKALSGQGFDVFTLKKVNVKKHSITLGNNDVLDIESFGTPINILIKLIARILPDEQLENVLFTLKCKRTVTQFRKALLLNDILRANGRINFVSKYKIINLLAFDNEFKEQHELYFTKLEKTVPYVLGEFVYKYAVTLDKLLSFDNDNYFSAVKNRIKKKINLDMFDRKNIMVWDVK